MYINIIKIQNFRIFKESEIEFIHPDQHFYNNKFPKLKLSNINLLLGNNGLGKTKLKI
jgi:AAA15 family ATPase/GTPase